MLPLEAIAGAMLAVGGGGVCVRLTGQALALDAQAKSWQVVPGTVLRSSVREDADADGVVYRVQITCGYSLDGRPYTTDRHTQGLRFAQPEQSARALVVAFPAGKAVDLRLDPAAPQAAVLLTGEPQQMQVIRRIGLAAIVAGIGLALFGLGVGR